MTEGTTEGDYGTSVLVLGVGGIEFCVEVEVSFHGLRRQELDVGHQLSQDAHLIIRKKLRRLPIPLVGNDSESL